MSVAKPVTGPIPVRPWAQSRHRMGTQDSQARNGSVRNGKTSNVSIIATSRSTNGGPGRAPTAAITRQRRIDIDVAGKPFIEFERQMQVVLDDWTPLNGFRMQSEENIWRQRACLVQPVRRQTTGIPAEHAVPLTT